MSHLSDSTVAIVAEYWRQCVFPELLLSPSEALLVRPARVFEGGFIQGQGVISITEPINLQTARQMP